MRAYEELFAGYDDDPRDYLQRTFEEVDGYDELVVLRDIRLESHCEHHMLPISAGPHVGYLPDKRVVGISKLARVVEGFARRLQIQEKLTAQIADTLAGRAAAARRRRGDRGRAQCMTMRGVHKSGVDHGDQPHAGRLPRQWRDASRVPLYDRAAIMGERK